MVETEQFYFTCSNNMHTALIEVDFAILEKDTKDVIYHRRVCMSEPRDIMTLSLLHYGTTICTGSRITCSFPVKKKWNETWHISQMNLMTFIILYRNYFEDGANLFVLFNPLKIEGILKKVQKVI
jgi:hypothetical protein